MQFNFIHQSRFCSEKLPFSSNGNVSPLIRFMTGLHHRVRHKEAGGGREGGREVKLTLTLQCFTLFT